MHIFFYINKLTKHHIILMFTILFFTIGCENTPDIQLQHDSAVLYQAKTLLEYPVTSSEKKYGQDYTEWLSRAIFIAKQLNTIKHESLLAESTEISNTLNHQIEVSAVTTVEKLLKDEWDLGFSVTNIWIGSEAHQIKTEESDLLAILKTIKDKNLSKRISETMPILEKRVKAIEESAIEATIGAHRREVAKGWESIMRNTMGYQDFSAYTSGKHDTVLNVTNKLMTRRMAQDVFSSESIGWRNDGFKKVIFMQDYSTVAQFNL